MNINTDFLFFFANHPARKTAIRLFVQGHPIAWKAPFHASWKTGKKVYPHQDLKEWENHVRSTAYALAPETPWNGDCVLIATVVLLRGKSIKKSKQFKNTSPDADNYTKAIGDALKGLYFEDDGRAVFMAGCKIFTDKPEEEGVVIETWQA